MKKKTQLFPLAFPFQLKKCSEEVEMETETEFAGVCNTMFSVSA